jgi:hypothetical protein
MDFSHDLAVRLYDQTGIDSLELKRLHNDLNFISDKLHDLLCEETLALPLHDQVKVLRVTAQGALSKVECLTDQLHDLIRYHS